MTKDFPQNFSFLCPIYPKTMLRAVAHGAVRRGPSWFDCPSAGPLVGPLHGMR